MKSWDFGKSVIQLSIAGSSNLGNIYYENIFILTRTHKLSNVYYTKLSTKIFFQSRHVYSVQSSSDDWRFAIKFFISTHCHFHFVDYHFPLLSQFITLMIRTDNRDERRRTTVKNSFDKELSHNANTKILRDCFYRFSETNWDRHKFPGVEWLNDNHIQQDFLVVWIIISLKCLLVSLWQLCEWLLKLN